MMTNILTPERRKAIHDAIPLLTMLMVTAGVMTSVQAVAVAGVALAVLDCLVAAVVTRSGLRTAIYGVAAAAAAVLVAWGIMSADVSTQVLGAASAVLGVILAGANTDVSTPDGTPAAEISPQHADYADEPFSAGL